MKQTVLQQLLEYINDNVYNLGEKYENAHVLDALSLEKKIQELLPKEKEMIEKAFEAGIGVEGYLSQDSTGKIINSSTNYFNKTYKE